ncbi:MAG: hypothetical protein M1826_004355 [Phylliscum demangeonii]|nr:MAG: hypothetical protein M1826_004355 [Phylliscum demangeonii]
MEFGYITTGESFVFLWVKDDDPTTLRWHLSEPNHCLLGLVRGKPDLDEFYPNVLLNRQTDTNQHAIDGRDAFVDRVKWQLNQTMDDYCQRLGKQGARGALFKITLASQGYTFVVKGTVEVFVEDLQHEGYVYQSRLCRFQGCAVPVYLGNIDLGKPDLHDVGVRIIHMLLSWAGKDLYAPEHEAEIPGVIHNDVGWANVLWNKERQRVLVCKTLLSASILNYPPPTLINFNRSSSSLGQDAGSDAGITGGILAYLAKTSSLKADDIALIVHGDEVWFQLPPELLLHRYHRIIEQANRRLLREFGSVRQQKPWQRPDGRKSARFVQKVVFATYEGCRSNSPGHRPCASVPSSTLPDGEGTAGSDASLGGGGLIPPMYLNAESVIGRVADVKAIYEHAVLKMQEEKLGNWSNIPLAMHTRRFTIPILLQHEHPDVSEDSKPDPHRPHDWWPRMWYQADARALLRDRIQASLGFRLWDRRGGAGGFWTDRGRWLKWREICAGFEDDLFRDGRGPWGREQRGAGVEYKRVNGKGQMMEDGELGP